MTQQLARGQVDAGENRRGDVDGALPGGKFARGALQRKQSEVENQPGFFSDRNEIAGAQPSKARMVPTQQRLKACYCPVFKPHHGPERDLDLMSVYGAAQIGLQRLAVGMLRAHARAEEFDPVAARFLRVGRGHHAVLEHVFALLVQLRVKQRNADGGGDGDFAIVEDDGRQHAFAYGLCNGDERLRIALGANDHCKFIARNARQRVLQMHQPHQAPRNGEQYRVAAGNADSFIDVAEAVDVDGDDRWSRVPVRSRLRNGGVEPVEEDFAIGQAGQVVVHGVMQHALFGGARLRHVGQRADHADHFAVGAHDRAGF